MKKDCINCAYGAAIKHEVCKSCEQVRKAGSGDPFGEPSNWKPNRKPTIETNADRIRAMSDEELAKFLCRNMTQDCSVCPGTKYCSFGHNGFIKWLGLPAEED